MEGASGLEARSTRGGGADIFPRGFVGRGFCGSQKEEMIVGEEQWWSWEWKVSCLEGCSTVDWGSRRVTVDSIECQCFWSWLVLCAVFGTMGPCGDVNSVC